jgi:hypothetical protein
MKRKLITALMFIALALLTACAARINQTRNQAMASWQGRTYDELLASWGPPSQIVDDGAGGKVVSYVQTRHLTTSRPTIYGLPDATVTRELQRYQMFWVNQDGIIYKWAWRD